MIEKVKALKKHRCISFYCQTPSSNREDSDAPLTIEPKTDIPRPRITNLADLHITCTSENNHE
ncbi:MAG: hypothetical protein OEZ48_12545 [Candidatus Bathyarchaeota archaeon]|nr:hypothetical protein [Candidatus Bathyarchaeota archaeon]